MSTSHVLLGLIVDRPDHAYRLKHRLSPGLPRERLINDGVLYPLLARMENDGLIRGREEVRAGRKRRVYRSTAAGRGAFADWLRSERDEDPGPGYELFTSHPLVKLLFSSHLQPAERRAKLAGFARAGEARLELLERLLTETPGEDPDSLNLGWLGIELEQQRSLLARLRALIARHDAHCAESPASS